MGTGLLAWQTRAGPAAQLLAAPGAAAFAWIILSWVMGFRHMYARLASLAVDRVWSSSRSPRAG